MCEAVVTNQSQVHRQRLYLFTLSVVYLLHVCVCVFRTWEWGYSEVVNYIVVYSVYTVMLKPPCVNYCSLVFRVTLVLAPTEKEEEVIIISRMSYLMNLLYRSSYFNNL